MAKWRIHSPHWCAPEGRFQMPGEVVEVPKDQEYLYLFHAEPEVAPAPEANRSPLDRMVRSVRRK